MPRAGWKAGRRSGEMPTKVLADPDPFRGLTYRAIVQHLGRVLATPLAEQLEIVNIVVATTLRYCCYIPDNRWKNHLLGGNAALESPVASDSRAAYTFCSPTTRGTLSDGPTRKSLSPSDLPADQAESVSGTQPSLVERWGNSYLQA